MEHKEEREQKPILIKLHDNFVDFSYRERYFVSLITIFFFIAAITYQTPHIAMWVGFFFAAYSAIANDSIQTIGTFIASNKNRAWWQLWLFMGGIFILTISYSWWFYGGDVSYKRLAAKGLDSPPTSFTFLQVSAPIFLMILTRLRMPVSTTFLLLSCFAQSGETLQKMLSKSLLGYTIAFVVAFLWWFLLRNWMKTRFREKAHPAWLVAQWIISAVLWSIWIMQDAANIAVYLPRKLDAIEFIVFTTVIFLGLGILFRMGGENIQEVIDEKNDVVDVRAATIIDLIYAVILYIFKELSQIPMSTTWVFIGLLAGRELAMTLGKVGVYRNMRETLNIIGKDIVKVAIGLLVSLILAISVNPIIRKAIFG